MNIALLGYGKMGKVIEGIAISRGHKIVAKLDIDTKNFTFNAADVAIDFSAPNAAFDNIKKALLENTPVISGTTGWLDKYDEAVDLCKTNNGAFIYASNFSLGVNLFFNLNTYLARMMQKFADYNISIEEMHHLQKKDTPSGTAISLAEQIIENSSKIDWSLDTLDNSKIHIDAKREPNVSGTHTVNYESKVDTLSIKHTAHNREGFALGAVLAAEWLVDKKGVYTMKDVLNIG